MTARKRLFHAEGDGLPVLVREPLLYLSLYFRKHRPTCYELMDRVRPGSDWEVWLD